MSGAEPEEERGEAPGRPDPWKGFRGVCSGVLILEAIAVLLGVPVVANFSDFSGLSWLPTTFVVLFAGLLVAACGMQSRPWALSLDMGLQLLLVAGWLVHPALGVTGLIFVVVWVLVWQMKRAVQRAQGARGDA